MEKSDSSNGTLKNQSPYASSRGGPNINSDLLSSSVNFLLLALMHTLPEGIGIYTRLNPILHNGVEVFQPTRQILACISVCIYLYAKPKRLHVKKKQT